MLKPKRPFRNPRTAKAAYPWTMWLMFPDGQSTKSFRLVKGKHYRCTTACMAQQVRSNCANRGISASIRKGDRDKYIDITIYKKESEYAEDRFSYRVIR